MNIVLGLTGASGVVYGVRLLDALIRLGHHVHTIVSMSAETVLVHELGIEKPVCLTDTIEAMYGKYRFRSLMPVESGSSGDLTVYNNMDYSAAVSSGSFLTDGMVVCPCTGSSLGCIANGVNQHLIHRAAEVHLKQHRPLILVVRETPMSYILLENQLRIAKAGGVILPASPHFYAPDAANEVLTVADLIDSIIARTLDMLKIEHPLGSRWPV